MSETTPVPTPDQLAAAAQALRDAPPPATLPSEAELAAGLASRQAAGPAGVTSVDVDRLLAGIAALQARVQVLEAEKASGAAEPVLNAAQALQSQVQLHAAHHPEYDHSGTLRLADDVVDAAKNAADSGDGSIVTELAGRLARALHKVHPNRGEAHYFRQALGFAEVHLPDSAAQLVPKPAQAPAGAVTSSGASVPVVQGSVTG